MGKQVFDSSTVATVRKLFPFLSPLHSENFPGHRPVSHQCGGWFVNQMGVFDFFWGGGTNYLPEDLSTESSKCTAVASPQML